MADKNSGLSEIYGKWNSSIDRLFGSKTPKARLIIFTSYVLSALTSILFSIRGLPLTTLSLGAPLSDAFLCSVSSFVPGAYIGAMLGTRFSGYVGVMRYLIITMIFLLRSAVSLLLYDGRYREPIHIRLCYCAVMCFTQCITHIVSNGLGTDIALRLLGTLISAPVICVIMSYYFAAKLKNSIRGSFILKLLHLLSAFFIFSCAIYCSKGIRFAGGSLACMLAVFLTLASAKRGGMIVGGVAGALLGYLYSPVYAAATAVIGAISGLFFFLGVLPAAGISAVAGCFIAFRTAGYTSLMSFMPECIISLAVASPVIRYSFFTDDFPFIFGTKSPSTDNTIESPRVNEERYGELMRLSNAFRELSGSLGSYTAASDEKTNELCSSVCHKFCDSCPVSPICWESERARTSECIKSMISAFRGNPSSEKAPKYLSEHCIKFKELTSEIEHSCKKARTPYKKDRSKSLVSSEYAAFSAILADLAENERCSLSDDAFSATVFKTVSAFGLEQENVTPITGKRKKIYLHGTDPELAERLTSEISKTTGISFRLTRPANAQNGSYLLIPAEKFKVQTAFSKLTKPGEIYSGDAAFAFSETDGRFFAILTDGMGSGSEAAECSGIASALLEKLLRCNIRKALAAEMLGDVLRKRGNECFCTVDILEADLVNGNASFLKNGAAASYILRHGSLHCVSAYSMPVGITEKTKPEEVAFTLCAGDIAVMVSDGIAAEPSDGNIFTDILTAGAFSSIQELADRILSRAVERNGRTDDMTVMVIEINEADTASEQKLG